MSRTAKRHPASKVKARGSSGRSLARRKRVVSKKPKKTPAAAASNGNAPAWACEKIFHHSRTALWEGVASPLAAETIYPPDLALIESLGQGDDVGAQWALLVHPIDRPRVARFFEELTQSQLPAKIDYRLIDRHGSVLWIRHQVEELSTVRGTVRVRGFVSDIQAEKEYQLESLRVSEREQNRIGQDLHDDLCQVLAGVSCLMRVFEGRILAKAPEEIENLKELNQQIVDAMHRTRALTHGLFPGKIQIADIRGALLELASQVKTRFNISINTRFAGRFPKHSSTQIIQIYRISQEAMTNAIKHGRATKIDVKLEALDAEMELTITDDGGGLPKSDGALPGVGLHIMKYRAGTLGGEVSVMDNSSRGVMVRLRYPFSSN